MTEMTSNINDLGNVLIRSDLNVPIKNGEIIIQKPLLFQVTWEDLRKKT